MFKLLGTVLQRTAPSHFAILLFVHEKQYSCYLSNVFIFFHIITARWSSADAESQHLDPALFRTVYKLELYRKKVHPLRNCLHQIGLKASLFGIFLINDW